MSFERISSGKTYMIRTQEHVFYVTVNDKDGGGVFELFVQPDDKDYIELVTVITRLASMAIREGVDPLVVAKELQDIHSPSTRHFIPGTSEESPSITARIGLILQEHIKQQESKNVSM